MLLTKGCCGVELITNVHVNARLGGQAYMNAQVDTRGEWGKRRTKVFFHFGDDESSLTYRV